MTDDLRASLAAIEKASQRLDRSLVLQSLQTGRPASAVKAALGEVGLPSPPELEALYGWRDGTSSGGDGPYGDIFLFPGFYLLSVEEAVANYGAFVTDHQWSIRWLPIFANGSGDFYVLDLSPSTARSVRHFRIEEEFEHPIEFNSLGALLATLAAAFERGVFFVDPDGYLGMDEFVFAELAAELNADVEWWRD